VKINDLTFEQLRYYISTQAYHSIQPVTSIQAVKEAPMSTFFIQGY